MEACQHHASGSTGQPWRWLLGGGILVFAAWVCGGPTGTAQAAEPATPPAATGPEKTTLPSPTAALSDPRRAEISQFFTELVRLRREADPWEFGRLFDLQGFVRETSRQGTLDGAGLTRVLGLWLALEFKLQYGGLMLTEMESNRSTVDRFRLGTLKFHDQHPELEAEVFVLFTGEFDDAWWSRFWLVKRDGRWRIYDHQRLDSGQRFSTSLAELGTRTVPGRELWAQAKEQVDQAWLSLQYGFGDANGVHSELITAARLAMHPATENRRRMYEVLVSQTIGDDQSTAKLLADLLKQPGILAEQPNLQMIKLNLMVSLGKPEEIVAAAQTFIDQVGADASVCEHLGTALLALDRKGPAAEAFRLGLAIDSNSLECLIGLAGTLPPEQGAEIGQYFAKFRDPRERFEHVAQELNAHDQAEALLAVVAAYRQIDREDPNADYYEAMAWNIKKEYRKSADLLKSALTRVTDEDERGYFLKAYHEAMISAGLVQAAYREAENQVTAFHDLGEILEQHGAWDELRTLADLHRKQHPRDPWVGFFVGAAAQAGDKFDEADKAFAEGMRWAVDADTLEQLRFRRVNVNYDAGRVLEAYKEIPPRRKSFAELAERLRSDEKHEVLEKLVKLHQEQDPRDPQLARWKAEVLWFHKDYPGAAKILLQAGRPADPADYQLTEFQNRLLRKLIQAEHFEEAENLALAMQQRHEDSWSLLLVYANWGDQREAMAAAEACVSEGRSIESFYSDPDLGPALKRPEFAQFRAKYPVPVEKPDQEQERE